MLARLSTFPVRFGKIEGRRQFRRQNLLDWDVVGLAIFDQPRLEFTDDGERFRWSVVEPGVSSKNVDFEGARTEGFHIRIGIWESPPAEDVAKSVGAVFQPFTAH